METPRVFVSHSHEDRDFCDALEVALSEIGADVWTDRQDSAGDLLDVVVKELQDRPIFVVVLSEAAFRSRWVFQECNWAKALAMDDRTRTIIPVATSPLSSTSFPREWFFIKGYRRIEAAGPEPVDRAVAIQRVVRLCAESAQRHSSTSHVLAEVIQIEPTQHLTPATFETNEPSSRSDPYPHKLEIGIANGRGWALVGSSRRGASSGDYGRYREDAFAIDLYGGWHLIAVADGSSAYTWSRVGANIAVSSAIAGLKAGIRSFQQPPLSNTTVIDKLTHALVSGIQSASRAIDAEAQDRMIPAEDLSATLLLVAHKEIPDGNLVAAAQIGDGVIVARDHQNKMYWLAAPDIGENNSTLFIPDISPHEWRQRVNVGILAPGECHILVLTDGVADDFQPIDKNLVALERALFSSVLVDRPPPQAAEMVTQLLGYERTGSFGDRTLVCLYRQQVPR